MTTDISSELACFWSLCINAFHCSHNSSAFRLKLGVQVFADCDEKDGNRALRCTLCSTPSVENSPMEILARVTPIVDRIYLCQWVYSHRFSFAKVSQRLKISRRVRWHGNRTTSNDNHAKGKNVWARQADKIICNLPFQSREIWKSFHSFSPIPCVL